MVGAYHKALPYRNSLKTKLKRGEYFFILIVHGVTFKGEDYIMNYIDA
jgi:hypothetical protein